MNLEKYGDDFIIKRIIDLCEKKNISRYRLSIKSGIAQSSLSTMLNRKTMPSISTLIKICNGFGISLAEFFADDDSIPELSNEQMELLRDWNKLTDHQKEVAFAFIQGIMSK